MVTSICRRPVLSSSTHVRTLRVRRASSSRLSAATVWPVSATRTWPGVGAGISPRGDERRERALAGDDLVGGPLGRLARGEGPDADTVPNAPGRVELGDVRVVAGGGEPRTQRLGGLSRLV